MDLNERVLKAPEPDEKAVMGQVVAPVAGPQVGPALGPDVGPDAEAEPRGPDIPMLAKPPVKVRVVFVCLYLFGENTQHQCSVLVYSVLQKESLM